MSYYNFFRVSVIKYDRLGSIVALTHSILLFYHRMLTRIIVENLIEIPVPCRRRKCKFIPKGIRVLLDLYDRI